jgi:hypothetical protein
MEEEKLVKNVKEKDISYTTYKTSMYSNLWYCDNKNKICITFTPRAGCSISFQVYLELIGLLKDGLSYFPNNFIHYYRNYILTPNCPYIDISTLFDNKYTFIKFIMNPYNRAVSIYRIQKSHNLSFRKYLKQLVNNELDYFNLDDAYHYHPQYIDGEENIITKYIKIDKHETFEIKLEDGTSYCLDANKYNSPHHGNKTDNTQFCGDLPKDIVNRCLPQSYKYFYDDEIKTMVETYYEKDIKSYGYSFDDLE